MTVEIAGYEGEWLDPGDVQGYLEERGIFIDPSSTFVEAEITLDPHDSTTAGSSATALTPQLLDGVDTTTSSLNADNSQWDDLFAGAGLTNVGFSDVQTGSFMNFLQPGESIKKTPTTFDAFTAPRSPRWSNDWMDAMDDTNDMPLISLMPVMRTAARSKTVVLDVRKLVKCSFLHRHYLFGMSSANAT